MNLQIENHALWVDGEKLADLPRVHYDCEVIAYSVPKAYRASGIYYSVNRTGADEAIELPASSTYRLIKSLNLPADEGAVLSQAKKEILEQAIAEADLLLETLEEGCAEREIKTWDQQAIEAASSGAENDLVLVDSIALYRGVGSEDLVGRINDKSIAYKKAAGAIIGAKQYVEDQIQAAESVEDLFAVISVKERIDAVTP